MKRVTFLLMFTAALALCVPTLAAAAATANDKAELQVQLWPDQASVAQMILSVGVPTSTPLPAVVRVPLPAGATVDWVGEISPEGGAGDVERQHKVEDGTGGQVVTFTLEKYRTGQVEASYKAPQTLNGKTVSTLDWVQSAPSASTDFAVLMSPTAADVTIDPAPAAAPMTNAQGERLYPVVTRSLKPGETFSMTVAYTVGASPASVASGGTDTLYTTLIVVLVCLLAAAVFAFVLVAVKARAAQDSGGETVGAGEHDEAAADAQEPPVGGSPQEDPSDDDPFRVDWE